MIARFLRVFPRQGILLHLDLNDLISPTLYYTMTTEKKTEMSDFEKQRLANIAERDALLKQLKLESQSAGLFSSSKTPKSNQKPKKSTPKRAKQESPPVPLRQSSRLRGIIADSETAKRKAEADYEVAKELERAKKTRRTDSYSASDMFIAGQKIDGDALIGVDVITKGVAEPYVRTFGDEDIEKTANKDLKALREEMNGLKLWEAWDPQSMLPHLVPLMMRAHGLSCITGIKITPERVYSMTFHPSESKPLVFAGDKMGHLGILDASQEKPTMSEDDEEDDPDPVLTTLKPHTRTISAMMIHPSKPTHLYTASYDSSIRELDLEKTTSSEKYGPPGPESTSIDEALSGVDMASDDPNTLYFSNLAGGFGRYDMRVPLTKAAVSTWQLSEKKIGGFSICPSQPHYFATASLDRTVKLWDLRNLSKKEPIPAAEHESRLSVSHAAFNALGQIATSSYDDTIKLYDLGAQGISTWPKRHELSDKEFRPDTVVRHNCQTGRWVTMYVPSSVSVPVQKRH